MAIDGVAPRAKLNQQRSRRFRSAKDMMETMAKNAKENKNDSNNKSDNDDGNTNPTQVFDSNCITPGTEFLLKVSNMIQYFIRKKLKEDVMWKHLLVIFSGPDIPGEGEHKIMSHIRAMRNDPHYAPNTTLHLRAGCRSHHVGVTHT
jgi:5'-3' exonuclease